MITQPKPRSPYSVAEIARVRELVALDWMDGEIARELGRPSAKSVQTARMRHGIHRSRRGRRVGDFRVREANQAEPLDEQDLAIILGGHPATLKRGGNVYSREAVEAVRRLAAAGLRDDQIRDKIHALRHRAPTTISKLRKRYGIPAGLRRGGDMRRTGTDG